MCGSSQAMNQINASQSNFYNTMTAAYQTEFGQNEAIFNELSSSLSPIVAAGPNQEGFSATELAALNSQVINQAGGTYANETQAANETMAARGGGNQLTPSGAQSQLQEEIGTAAENQEAGGLQKVSLANYATGRQNYANAVGALSGLPGAMENPASTMAGEVTGAGGAAMQGANEINQANNSWMGLVGGVLGNLAGNAGLFGGGGGGDNTSGAWGTDEGGGLVSEGAGLAAPLAG